MTDNPMLRYLIQNTLWLAILYGLYWLWLRRETFFRLNRVFILAAVLFSIGVPFIKIPVVEVAQPLPVAYLPNPELPVATKVLATKETVSEPMIFNWQALLFAMYITGAAVYLLVLAWRLLQLWQLCRRLPIEKKNGYSLVLLDNRHAPVFSFLHWLFWNENALLTETERQQILAHELVHIRQKHSWDILFFELLTVVFWFNPFLYLFKKEIRTVHEFLADQAGVQMTTPALYARLVYKQILQDRYSYLVQPFHSSHPNLRIAMLQRMPSSRFRLAKYAAIALAAISAEVIIAPKTVIAQTDVSVKSSGKLIVTGKVLSAESHQPLAHATVVVTGANTGSITNEKGEYRLKLDNPPVSLTFSYVGYKTLQVPYNAQQQLVVEMQRKDFVMEQVVVVAYRNQSAATNGHDSKPEPLTPPKPTEPQTDLPAGTFVAVEQMPEFPGGKDALYKHIMYNLRYPKEAREKNIQGDVFVKMIIDEEGKVGNVSIAQSTSPELNAEALRLAMAMPRWRPARQNNKSVAVSYILPIRFDLE